MAISRRRFLFGTAAGVAAGATAGVFFRAAGGKEWRPSLLRPPGALPESDFLAACVRCGQCVEACPFNTLKLAGADAGVALGTPFFDAEKIPCYLCQGYDELECIAACPTKALQPVADLRAIAIGTAILDEKKCLAYNRVVCRSCWHACPFPNEAISFDSMPRPVVNDDACIGCGLCTHACPTESTSIPILPARERGRSDS